MNFEFSEEQDILRDQAHSYLKDKCPVARVREILDGDEPYCRELWAGMAELGWLATTIPEVYGGHDLGYLELCVLAEELGRSLAPTPFSSSVYLATEALLLYGSDAQKQDYLPKMARGELIGTLAVAEGAATPGATSLKVAIQGGHVTGRKLPVADGDVADFVIVLARDGAAASMVLVDLKASGTRCAPLAVLDPTRSQAAIEFSGAPGELLGVAGEGWPQLRKLYNRAAIPFAFEQVGGAQACLDMAREYALQRYAFGRPIASFQAIKHKLADMYIGVTLARSNCYYGAWALSCDAAELPVAAATARVSGIEAFHECAKENIQTHGGMGFTWEFDCHLYYRRSKLLAVNLGSLDSWKDRLITAIEQSNLQSTVHVS